jgi:uncharacterized protein with gpF-like domain
MISPSAEESVYQTVKGSLTRWLGRAKDAVLASWREFKAPPNAGAVDAQAPAWQAEVDRIIAALTPALIEGWSAAHLPGDYNPQDPYVQANLALTKNLLVGIPDEVHALVVREILEGTNAGETVDQIAHRVDNVLTYTGSANWDNRARVIAQTECNRHYNGSLLAHALLSSTQDKKQLTKEWDTRMDGKERPAHHLANGQSQSLNQPFIVDGEPLLFPGDPTGHPANVINCRCGMKILDVKS